MQPLNHKKLIGLPVKTKSGDYLGKVISLEIDIDSQSIINYNVEYSNILKRILKDKLLINRNQIISIARDGIIVEDNVLTEREREKLSAELKTVAEGSNIIQSETK